MKYLKRVLAWLMVMSLLISACPITFAANIGDPPTDVAAMLFTSNNGANVSDADGYYPEDLSDPENLVSVERLVTSDEQGFMINMYAKSDSTILGTTLTFVIDTTKILPARANGTNSQAGTLYDLSGNATIGAIGGAGVPAVDPNGTFTAQTTAAKMLDDKYAAIKWSPAGDSRVNSNGRYRYIGSFRFGYVEGVTRADLDKTSIRLVEDGATGAGYGIAFDGAAIIYTGNSGTNYGYEVNPGTESTYAAWIEKPILVYPRSTVQSAVTLKVDAADAEPVYNVTKNAETGELSLAAPELDKTYTAETPLATLVVDEASLGTDEEATVDSITVTDSGNGYGVDTAGHVTSGAIAKETEMTATVNVTVTEADGTSTYPATIDVTIPAVVLPAWELTPAAGTVMDKDGGWKPSELVAKFFTGTDDWTLNQDANQGGLADDELPAKNAEGVYEIPVFKAGNDTTNRDTYATFKATIVETPKSGNVDSVVANSAYDATTTSLWFREATNPDWEYAYTTNQSADAATLAGLTYVRGKAAPAESDPAPQADSDAPAYGVRFDGLTPGTDYYLVVRAAALEDGTAASAPVMATTAAVTVFDVEVTSAYLAGDADKTEIVKRDENNTQYLSFKTRAAITTENAAEYEQRLTLTNINTRSLTNLSVSIYDVDPETGVQATEVSQLYTAAFIDSTGGDHTYGTVASGETFYVKVSVADAQRATLGVHTANLVLTADGEDGTVGLLNKTIKVEMVVYGGREDGKDPADVIFRPANSSDSQYLSANAGTVYPLDVAWNDADGAEKAASYELILGDGEAAPPVSVKQGKDIADAPSDVDADSWYLVVDQDITELGRIAKVQANFPENDQKYLVADVAVFDVYVKADPNTPIVDGEGKEINPAALKDVYDVIRPAASQDPTSLDLLENLKNLGQDITATVDVKAGSALLDNTSLTNGVVSVPSNAALGEMVFTVTIPENDKYDEKTVDVTVYVVEETVLATPADIDLVIGDAVDGGKVQLAAVPGATYTAKRYDWSDTAYAEQGVDVAVEDQAISMNTVDGPVGKIEVAIEVPAKHGDLEDGVAQWKAPASAVQTVRIREKGALTANPAVYDLEDKDAGASTALSVSGGSNISYTLTSGEGIITLENGTFTVPATITKYGKAVITASSKQTLTQTAASTTIEVYVRKENDGGSSDVEIGDPTNGTGAVIRGMPTGSTEFTEAFNEDADGDGVNDTWNPTVDGVRFFNLKENVRYEVRFFLAGDDGWYKGTDLTSQEGNPDENGWWTYPDSAFTLDTANPENGVIFTWVPVGADGTEDEANYKLLRAQIRYKDDGTVGDTTVDDVPSDRPGEDDKYHAFIRDLNPNLNYQYRVTTKPVGEDTTETVEAWTDLPMDEAIFEVISGEGETAVFAETKTYEVVRDDPITNVETRYTSKPSASKNDKGDFIITGLIPNANYDLAPASEGDFAEAAGETPANYIVKRASGDGVITIKAKDDESSESYGAEYVFLELDQDGVNSVLYRLSKTDDTKAGEKEEVASGVTVSGKVYSYNRYNSITVELYLMSDLEKEQDPEDGTPAKPVVTEVFGGEESDGTWSAGRVEVSFEIKSVPAETYQLRISKPGHLTTYINNLVVGLEDLALDMTAQNNGKEFVNAGYESAVNLITGELTGDGQVTTADRAVVMDGDNIDGAIGGANEPVNVFTDLSGDGQTTTADRAIIMDSMNLDKTEADCTFDLSGT